MTTYRTGNPLGSKDPRDLYDNAENFDAAINDVENPSFEDRFGRQRTTLKGYDDQFQQFLINSGYVGLGPNGEIQDYAPGLEITARNQIFWRDGELYRAGAVLELPYTTTGDWGEEEGLFVAMGDAALRQELADTSSPGNGASMIGVGDAPVDNLGDAIAPLLAAPDGNLYLASFFRSNADPSICIYASQNGKDFSRLSGPMNTGGVPFIGRDPSIYFRDGVFYVAVTGYSADNFDATIWRSRDLYNWEKKTVTLGATPVCSATNPAPGGSVPCENIWAPEFYDDGTDVYLLVSLRYAANQPDVNGSSVPFFRPFYSRCSDIDTLTFEAPVEFNIPADLGNKIDPAIHSFGSSLIMAVKDEFDKKIEVFEAPTIAGPWVFKNEIPTTWAEGPCITKVGDSYRVYFDRYGYGTVTGYVDTTDFATYTQPEFIGISGPHRHGTIISLDGLSNPDKNYVRARMSGIAGFAKPTDEALTGLVNLPAGNVSLRPANGVVYAVTGSNVATLNIEAATAEEFYLLVASGSAAASIKIPHSAIYYAKDGVEDSFSAGEFADRFITIRKYFGSAYRAMDVGPAGYGSMDLVTSAGTQNITSAWNPKYGWTYTTSGGDVGETVINSLPNFPDGFYFNLKVASGSPNGAIRLKSTVGSMGGRDALFRGDLGWDGVTIRLEKTAGSWSISQPSELANSVTYNPGTINSATESVTTVSVPGAQLGDFVEVAFSQPLGVVELDASVSASGTVTVRFRNRGSTTTINSGTLKVRVRR